MVGSEAGAPMKALLNLFFAIAVIAYPFLVYWGLTRFQPRVLALMLLGLFAMRWVVAGKLNAAAVKSLLPVAGAVAATMSLVLIFGDGRLLLLNPVFINLVFLAAFAYTLRRPPSMIERFARLRENDLPAQAIPYCRKVTIVWCVFFLVNGGVALWTALAASVKVWTLYNGLISYGLMGVLFAIEYLVRRVQMRKHAAMAANGKTLALSKAEPP